MQNLCQFSNTVCGFLKCPSFISAVSLTMKTTCPFTNARCLYFKISGKNHMKDSYKLPVSQWKDSSDLCVSNLSGQVPNNCNIPAKFQRHLSINTSSHCRAANKENISLNYKNVSDCIECSNNNVLETVKDDFLVYDDFITEEEETSILQETEPYLNRLKYEQNHWDDAIHGFRETERKKWSQKNKAIIQRVRDLAFPTGVQQLAYVHILDIKKSGYIKAHVDAVRFCGNTIAGISLLSSAVMRLVHTENKDWFADALLKRRSLYIMRNVARYKFTHEVLGEDCSKFRGEVIPRDRRISVICRNEPSPEDRQ